MEWMILPFKRYADFQGRSRRMEYWMFQLFNIIVLLVLGGPAFFALSALDPASMGPNDDPFAAFGVLGMISFGLIGLYTLIVFIPALAVTVRRFHDRGLSGWIYLALVVAGLIPFIGFIASIAAFVITVLPGNEGQNQYGPDPKNPYDEEVFA